MSTRVFNLEERLIGFAVQILDLIEALPNNTAAQILARQLARSSTSAALNYGEAQAYESPKDFIHKMSVCLKELRESQVSLKIIRHKPYLIGEKIDTGLRECTELVAIFVASIKTKKRTLNP